MPFQNHHAGFRTYLDFMNAVPQAMRRLPVFITETDQTEPWSNRATGWVQQAYAEINGWNEQPGNQKICALVLYRWPRTDMWYIEGKQAVIVDDMIDTGGTICAGAQMLKDQGATEVYACAAHPVFSGPAVERLAESIFDEVIVTNSIPLSAEALKVGKIKQLSVAPILGEAIGRINHDLSVSEMFE